MTPKLKGPHPWLVILCVPSDRVTLARPATEYFQDFIAGEGKGGLYDFWSQVSAHTIDFTGSRVLGWYTLAQTVAQIDNLDRSAVAALARAAASAAGADLSGYRYTLAFVMGSGHFGAQGADVICGVSETPGQPGWRWCSKCESLAYWDASRAPGACAAGGQHDHAGSSYYAVEHDAAVSGAQAGWRWCRKCEVLAYGASTPVPCAAGGDHDLTRSFDYVLRQGTASDNAQNDWRWCCRCQGLAYNAPGRPSGACPAGGNHDHTRSAAYRVPYAWAATVGGLGHETGHGLGFNHAFGTSRSGDLGNDSRPGAYGDWTDIMSWDGTAKFAAPRFTPAGAGMSAPALRKLGWLNTEDVVRVTVGSGTHTAGIGPLYGAGNIVRALEVVHPAQNRIYTASFRPATGWDKGLLNARVVVQAERTLYGVGQDCWLWCQRCAGMVHGGDMLCPAGGVHDGSNSQDYGLLHDVGATSGQNNWRWCRRCSGLVFAGGGTSGLCPAGGAHDLTQSSDYTLPTGGAGQGNWRWCQKCQGLMFGGNAVKGACPGGGFHDPSRSANYVLGAGADANRQNLWRWCGKCQGLFFAGLGACKGGDAHVLVGSDYALAQNITGAGGQEAWRWCSKCRALAFYDGSRAAGACAAGGVHDHGASGRYTLPTDAEARSGQTRWFWCGQCSALHYVDATRGAGRCAGGGNHAPGDLEYVVAHDTRAVAGNNTFRWCRKCECMVLGDNPAGCSASGAHDTTSSARYVVRTDPQTLVREQSFWRTCSKCSVLMALASANGSNEKPCPVGGMHTPQGEYFVTFKTDAPFWRWCSKCELLAYWDGTSTPGPCAAGGTHDHRSSLYYAPPRLEHDAVQVLAANLQAGERYAVAGTSITFEVVAINASSASVQVTA